jgi:hypothetical protein
LVPSKVEEGRKNGERATSRLKKTKNGARIEKSKKKEKCVSFSFRVRVRSFYACSVLSLPRYGEKQPAWSVRCGHGSTEGGDPDKGLEGGQRKKERGEERIDGERRRLTFFFFFLFSFFSSPRLVRAEGECAGLSAAAAAAACPLCLLLLQGERRSERERREREKEREKASAME